jgi:hypothetical protein
MPGQFVRDLFRPWRGKDAGGTPAGAGSASAKSMTGHPSQDAREQPLGEDLLQVSANRLEQPASPDEEDGVCAGVGVHGIEQLRELEAELLVDDPTVKVQHNPLLLTEGLEHLVDVIDGG